MEVPARAETHRDEVAYGVDPFGGSAVSHGAAAPAAAFDRLPSRLNNDHGDPVRTTLERFGFAVHRETEDFFLHVTPPAGWTIEPPPHSMWLDLLDAERRKRGAIFMPSVFYDRSARIDIYPRFIVRELNLDADEREIAIGEVIHFTQWAVVDTQTRTHRYRTVPRAWLDRRNASGKTMQAAFAASMLANDCCITWLDTAYPGWQAPGAHWD